MARRVTMDMPADRARAWQDTIAGDPSLRQRLAVYVIRQSGQLLPVGASYVKSPFLKDADNTSLRKLSRGTLAIRQHVPKVHVVDEYRVPRGSVGCEFISDAHLALDGIRERVETLLAQRREARHALITHQDEIAILAPAGQLVHYEAGGQSALSVTSSRERL